MPQRFPHVLVVDGSVTIRVTLEKALTDAGYSVRTAVDGTQALKHLQEFCPEYILLDRQIPGGHGHDLCRRIRAAHQSQYIYVILMTGYTDMINFVDGLGAGADDYIAKPIDVRELLARMQAGSRVLDLDRRLTDVARHDPLTGVLNRRDLVASVDRMIDVGRPANHASSCIMVDIDHFKSINDLHGHLAGDTVLIQVAKLLKEQSRSSDFVCRYGGEEFVVILPNCSEKEAAGYAERARANIESQTTLNGADPNTITASFGVADNSGGVDTLELINRADAALLSAKRAGRNCIQRFTQLDESEHLLPALDIFAEATRLP